MGPYWKGAQMRKVTCEICERPVFYEFPTGIKVCIDHWLSLVEELEAQDGKS